MSNKLRVQNDVRAEVSQKVRQKAKCEFTLYEINNLAIKCTVKRVYQF